MGFIPPDPDPAPDRMGFLPHDVDPDPLPDPVVAARDAVLADRCPCPGPDPAGAVTIPTFLVPVAERGVARFGPEVLALLVEAGELATAALVTRVGGGGPPTVAPAA